MTVLYSLNRNPLNFKQKQPFVISHTFKDYIKINIGPHKNVMYNYDKKKKQNAVKEGFQ